MKKYGDLRAGAKAAGVPYKTFYRAFTENGADRTQQLTLDFILDVCEATAISADEVIASAHTRTRQ